MYPMTNIQVRQSFTESTVARQGDSRSLSWIMAVTSFANRATAILRCRSEKPLDVAGKSGRTKAAIKATPIVAAPSTINSHRQPLIPCVPSSPLTITAQAGLQMHRIIWRRRYKHQSA